MNFRYQELISVCLSVCLVISVMLVPARVTAETVDELFITVIDSHLVSVEQQVNDLRQRDNQSVFSNISRLDNNIERAREQFGSYRSSLSDRDLEQFLSRTRAVREALSELRTDVSEELDDEAIELLEDGIDWDEFRENRSVGSGSSLPGELRNQMLYRELSAMDELLSRIQRYVILSIQAQVTEQESTYQFEYLVETLTLSFRSYLEDRIRDSRHGAVSASTYRHTVEQMVGIVMEGTETGIDRLRRQQVGQTIRYQGRILLELLTDERIHHRVLTTLNDSVRQLLPGGGGSDRYDALKR